jgi:hypothetical protein
VSRPRIRHKRSIADLEQFGVGVGTEQEIWTDLMWTPSGSQ